MECPVCGTKNRIGAIICEKCHTDLYDSLLEKISTKQLAQGFGSSHDGTSPTSNPVVVYFTHDAPPVALERITGIVIGRNEKPSDNVGLDLTPFGGQDQGVSRHHARLDADFVEPMLTDLGSTNGTFINGQKLTPNMLYPLRSGDEVRFGRLVVRVYYK